MTANSFHSGDPLPDALSSHDNRVLKDTAYNDFVRKTSQTLETASSIVSVIQGFHIPGHSVSPQCLQTRRAWICCCGGTW